MALFLPLLVFLLSIFSAMITALQWPLQTLVGNHLCRTHLLRSVALREPSRTLQANLTDSFKPLQGTIQFYFNNGNPTADWTLPVFALHSQFEALPKISGRCTIIQKKRQIL